VLFLAVLGSSQYTPSCTLTNKLAKANVSDPRYCPYIWASGLSGPRGVEIAANGDVLIVENSRGVIAALWDDNRDGVSGSNERATLATQTGLNHGIVIDARNGFLYASNPTDVYRWKYTSGQRTNLGTSQHVISNIPCCHHTTRTLRLSPDGTYLYVQSGSEDNVAPDPGHAQIHRFKVASLGGTVVDWNSGEVVAVGLRNEVGIRFDPTGRLWGVENGVDDLYRADLGGDIHNDNPCEELNLLEDPTIVPGSFYGYPYCWSEGILPTYGKGPCTQWLQPDFQGKGVWTDAWCQTVTNVRPPLYCFPAHNAPLDILFGNITDASRYKMHAYVSAHGSWDRTPPDGYNVREVMWDSNNMISSSILLQYAGPGTTGAGWIRPVGLGITTTIWGQTLMITDDGNGYIVGLSYL